MRNFNRSTLIFAAALVWIIGAMALPEAGKAQGQGAPIWLRSEIFTPGGAQASSIPPGLFIAGYAQNQRGYYIVQFSGPVQQPWKDQLISLGADILYYIPDFAFKVRMNPGQASEVEALPFVSWAGIFQPAYKLNPDLDRSNTNLFAVRIEQGADFGRTRALVAATGVQVLSSDGDLVVVAADSDQLDVIANILDVASVDNYMVNKKHNDYASGVILRNNEVNPIYDGSSQTIAVADTGLGGGTKATAHVDIEQNRIIDILNLPGAPAGCFSQVIDDGAIDVDSGHGTHVTTSALGSGETASHMGKGVASGASLVFQAVENWANINWICSLFYGYQNGYYLTGIPSDLKQLFQQSYDENARIASNSWGSDAAGAYTADSANVDTFIWQHPDMTITFSAGNAGVDANSDGVIDSGSLGSPASAKNVIAVGASENARTDGYPCDSEVYAGCAGRSGSNVDLMVTYGTGWGYPANPIKDDKAYDNEDQMAAFSSRGPAADGRIKPDVVAPGTYILSGYSDLYQQYYDPAPNPQNNAWQYDGWADPYSFAYKYMGGTSMSNPLVAGGAAVVRDYYQKHHNHPASAALVKAAIINSAVDMPDENNDGVNDNYYPIPNVHEGWGRVDLQAATNDSNEFKDETAGLATGESASYQVTTNGGPLKITLVWSDYPSASTAAVNLVNDLDLTVTRDATTYRGNVFSGGWSVSGGNADRRNNVENVYIQTPGTGTYTVQVQAYNIPYGPQPYAMVVSGGSFSGSGSNQPPTAIASANPTSGIAPLTVNFSSAGSMDSDGTIVSYSWAFGDNGTSTEANPGHTYNNAGSYTATLTVTDDDGATGTNSVTITVSSPPNSPPTAVALANPTSGAAPLTVQFDGISSSDSDGTITGYSWTFGDSQGATGANPSHDYAVAGTYTATLTVTDDDDATGTDSITISVSGPPNSPPTAVASADPTSGNAPLTVQFTGSGSTDPEGGVLTYNWSFGDGGTSTAADPSHTYTNAGTYTATLTVTDNGGATDESDPIIVTVIQSTINEMHVGNLLKFSLGSGATWVAGVSITIHDADHTVLSGATVYGTWKGGYNGTAVCTTNTLGFCQLTSGGISMKRNKEWFTVTNVTHPTYAYNPALNHDTDGDSDGTTIVIPRP